MRKPRPWLWTCNGIIAALALSSGDPARAEPPAERSSGTIQVVVRFTGKVPPATKFTTTDGRALTHHDLVVDPKTKGLRDVVGVLADAPAPPNVENAEPALVDQRDSVFVPRVVAVRHGQAVRFDNSDQFNHSVSAASVLADNQLNVFVVPGKPVDHVFAPQRHPVQIGCVLHPWMRAWVYVLPHPWFAVSDAQGRLRIGRVPPGKYTLWLRHADAGLQERRPVDVRVGKITELTVEWAKVGK